MSRPSSQPAKEARAARPAPPRRKRAASDLTTTVLASIAIALPLMFYLRQHVEILRYGYEIESLKERRAELQEQSRELSIQRASAAALPEIERRAAALGLVAPAPSDVFVAVEDGPNATPAGSTVPQTARLE
jgi:hypothetical protein